MLTQLHVPHPFAGGLISFSGGIRRNTAVAVRAQNCLYALLGLLSVLPATGQTANLNPEHIPSIGPTHVQAEGISFQLLDDVRVTVKSADGVVLPTRGGRPISLDDPASMKVRITSARTSIGSEALTHLLNEYTLPHAGTAVHDLAVSFEDHQIHIEGKLKKVVDLPFAATGELQVTSEGDIRIHFTKIVAAGFLHKKMMDWLGIKLSAIARPNSIHSFRVVDDDVIFPIYTLFPAPHFTGRLRSAEIVGDALEQTFGEPRSFPPAPVPSAHYLYFRGGVLQFGRLTMHGVDLELLNKDEGAPLTISFTHLFDQIGPGFIKNTPERGIVAYIESYGAKPLR
jgi:hypothetical protein